MAYDTSSVDIGESTKKSDYDQLLANNAFMYAAIPPLGSILAWAPGYFAAAGNGGGWTDVTITLSDSWKECDGAALSAEDSPDFGGASHYLPDLTDDRFLMGDTVIGVVGGANSVTIASGNLPTHTHAVGTLATAGGSSHTHLTAKGGAGDEAASANNPIAVYDSSHGTGDYWYWLRTKTGGDATVGKSGPENAHTHTITGSTANGGFANTAIDNRPVYLTCKFIMRVE